jgi:hypothetical protein
MSITWSLPILNLSMLDWRSADSIVIADTSTYTILPAVGLYTMNITVPGYPLPYTVPFVPGVVNVFKCADLGVTCSDTGCTPLPDGIYDINYTVQTVQVPASSIVPPTTAEFKFIKIDTIKCKYQHAFLQVDLNCGCHDPKYTSFMQELRMIKVYIDGSVAECNNSNYRLSYEYYKKADWMLDKLKCKFPSSKWSTCNCG